MVDLPASAGPACPLAVSLKSTFYAMDPPKDWEVTQTGIWEWLLPSEAPANRTLAKESGDRMLALLICLVTVWRLCSTSGFSSWMAKAHFKVGECNGLCPHESTLAWKFTFRGKFFNYHFLHFAAHLFTYPFNKHLLGTVLENRYVVVREVDIILVFCKHHLWKGR